MYLCTCIYPHTRICKYIYIYNCVSVDIMIIILFNVIRLFSCLVSCPMIIILFRSCHNKSCELYIHIIDEFASPCQCKSQSNKDVVLACVTFDHFYLNTV